MNENNVVFCPNCGMKNENGDMFCGNCGTKLEMQIDQPKPTAMASPSARMPEPAKPQGSNSYYSNVSNGNGAQNHMTTYQSGSGNVASDPEKGKSHATASLVLGIVAVVCWFFGYSSIISVICGFIGLTLAGKAKEEGFEGGTRTAGFVLSLIGLIGGAIVLIACVACVGSLGILGASM